MKAIVSFAGALLLACFAPLAHANFQISYQVGAGPIINCANSGTDTLASCFAVPTVIDATSGLQITQLTGTSNSPGTASQARQTGSVVDIINTNAVTLKIWLAAQDFTAPTTPPAIDYKTSLTIIPTTGIGSATLESCVDTSNGTAPPLGSFCSSSAATLNNATSYAGTTSLASNNESTISSLSGTYSLSQLLTLTLGAGSEVEVQTRQVLTPVPEPISIALLGAVFLLTSRSILRKRKQAPQVS